MQLQRHHPSTAFGPWAQRDPTPRTLSEVVLKHPQKIKKENPLTRATKLNKGKLIKCKKIKYGETELVRDYLPAILIKTLLHRTEKNSIQRLSSCFQIKKKTTDTSKE